MALRLKQSAQLAFDRTLSLVGHRDQRIINVPACGIVAAEDAKRVAFAAGKYVRLAVMPHVTYRKRREVDLDFMYLAAVTAQNGNATYFTASREV